MDSLIERAEKARDQLDARGDARTMTGKLDTPDTRVITDAQNIINELITALSPVMPDDVLRVINALIYDDSGVDAAIDMLERLQRELSILESQSTHKNTELILHSERIAELEAKIKTAGKILVEHQTLTAPTYLFNAITALKSEDL